MANISGTSGRDIISGTPVGDRIEGRGGADRLHGLGGSDLLNGGAGNDILHGGSGNDILIGGLRNDTLIGGPGNDLVIGGLGNDLLVGGLGRDVFAYRKLGDGIDRIQGFVAGVDRLDLSDLLDFESGDNLAGFVRLTPRPQGTTLAVDPNGGGTFTRLAFFQGVLLDALSPEDLGLPGPPGPPGPPPPGPLEASGLTALVDDGSFIAG